MDITYVTGCWEKSWQHILSDKRLDQIIETNQYPFKEKLVIINNVEKQTIKPMVKAIEHAIKRGAFTNYYFVEDYEKETLNALNLRRDEIGIGYVYSITEWVGLHLCKTKYMLHYMGDCISATNHDWITPSLNLLENYPEVTSTTQVWDHKYHEPKLESQYEIGDFYISNGFSDQCFIVRREEFYADIYRERYPDDIRYPAYGGDLFERRVYAWMRNHNKLRGIYKHSSYIHRNWI
jgi:hypothetical protein